MKNPHERKVTRFMIQVSSKAIHCGTLISGPSFGDEIVISDRCNEFKNSYINFSGTYGCKDSSLFVCKPKSNERNYFRVLDYEVYALETSCPTM